LVDNKKDRIYLFELWFRIKVEEDFSSSFLAYAFFIGLEKENSQSDWSLQTESGESIWPDWLRMEDSNLIDSCKLKVKCCHVSWQNDLPS
jgi:hypothetical protein